MSNTEKGQRAHRFAKEKKSEVSTLQKVEGQAVNSGLRVRCGPRTQILAGNRK